VLIGAVTLLLAVVAVFLSYNANKGLPFVPTYELTAELPNAANVVRGNEVRAGGTRVGTVSRVRAIPNGVGRPTAALDLKLDEALKPLPVDSTVVVRSGSALGLKYVELTVGKASAGFPAGSRIPVRAARPRPVEIDEVFNTFDAKTRRGAQRSLDGLGGGLAGRGTDLNTAILSFRPLLDHLEPVAGNLADRRTRLARLVTSLGRTAAEVAPVAKTQAALFANLNTTFASLSSVSPFLQELISESPPTLQTGIDQFPRQRPFLRNSATLLRELAPGIETLPTSAPVLADALAIGRVTLPRTPGLNRRLADVFDSLAAFAQTPLVPRAIRRLRDTAASLRPTLRFLTPAQTRCNYGTLLLRNGSSLLSEGDGNGTWQRFIILAAPAGPNNEGGPSDAPASGPGPDNYLHSNPYPNTAAPGQVAECEAGNEDFIVGETTIGNVPGNQGLVTGGQQDQAQSSSARETP